MVLEMVAANPMLQGTHVVNRALVQQGLERIEQPTVRKYASTALVEMLQGTGPSFAVLQGTSLEPLAACAVEQDAVVFPEGAWAQERVLPCLAEVATTNPAYDEPPPQPDPNDALLREWDEPMDPNQLRNYLEQLLALTDNSLPGGQGPVASVVRTLVQQAQFDGPLRLIGGPPSVSDIATFYTHLHSLSQLLNTLHDPKVLGEYLQSSIFPRAKYELFALQHMQLLAWLQRVQTGLAQGDGKNGPEALQFLQQIAHAARVLLFQPLIVHVHQVMLTVSALPANGGGDEVPGSMQNAMTYPPDTATDEDRVEWLQLNLLLQFQTVYKSALCNTSIYQGAYSPGEQQLLGGMNQLHEIYSHVIGRFPQCCPLSEQEQAVLTQLCQKLNKFFTDGKQIKQILDSQPGTGKQTLVQNRIGGATTAQYAVRDWIIPFMVQFTDLLKVLWTLWIELKKKNMRRIAVESIARQVGRCIVEQLADETAALRAPPVTPPADHGAIGGRRAPDNHGNNAAAQAIGGLAAGSAAGDTNGYSAQAPAVRDGGGQGWASIVRRQPVEPPAGSAVAERPRPSAAVPAVAPKKAVPKDDENVRVLVARRETARFARDFESADKLREQLARLGVTLDDQNKTWRAADGRSGPITQVNISELHAQKAAKSGAATLPDEEIDRLVKEREQARFTSDYKTADRLRDTLEKHGVHLDTKENKWQSIDGRSGPIGPVNISAAHAQKAARQGAPKMPIEEIERILVQREQARARRDYKTADVLRDTLEKHGVYLDPKENKWHSTDGRSGNTVMSTLSDDEVSKILANRQAARLRHDYKTADRLRDQLNEQCVSVDDKKNRWDASDGRSGSIEPFTCVHAPPPDVSAGPAAAAVAIAAAGNAKGTPSEDGSAPASAAVTSPTPRAEGAAAAGKGESKRVLPEKARRELAKQLRAITGASARLCEKALQSHDDNMERAANWLLDP